MKKISGLLLSIFMMSAFTFMLAGCTDTTIVDITLDTTQVVDELDFSEDLNMSSLLITAKQKDGTEVVVSLDDAELNLDMGGFNKEVPGTYIITYSYRGCSGSFEVTVAEPDVTGFSIDRSLIPETVAYGTDLDLSDLKVYANREDGSRVLLNQADYLITQSPEYNKNLRGTYQFKVEYGDFEDCFFSVSVTAQVVSIVVDSSGVDCDIAWGEALRYDNLVITTNYQDDVLPGSVSIADPMITVDDSAVNTRKAGLYTVVVIFNSSETIRDTFNVTVAEPLETGFRVDRSAIPESVAYNTTVDFSLVKVLAVFEDGAESELPASAYSINTTAYNKILGGTYNIEVSYKSYASTAFSIIVETEINSLELDTTNVKKDLSWNEEYDFTNLVIRKVYQDGEEVQTTLDDALITLNDGGFDATVAGTYTITVKYDNSELISASFDVTVAEPLEIGFRVDRSEIPESVTYNTEIDFTKVKVIAIFEDESEVDLTTDYLVDSDAYNKAHGGTYVVKVNYNAYEEQSFNVTVTVEVVSIELDTTNVDKDLAWGEEISLTNLVITAIYQDSSESTNINIELISVDLGGFDATVAGTYTITVIYNNSEVIRASFDVAVAEPLETGFRVDRSEIPETVTYNTDIDFTKVKVYSTKEDNSEELLTTGYTVDYSAYNKALGGTYTIKVDYKEYVQQTFTIVVTVVPSAISVDVTNVETTLPWNADPDLTNIKFIITMQDGTTETVNGLNASKVNVDMTGFSKNVAGSYDIPVSLVSNSLLTSLFNIVISEPEETGFRVDSSAIPAIVIYGSTIDWTALVVYKQTEDGLETLISASEYTLMNETFNNEVPATYTITVRYSTFTDQTFTIVVENYNDSLRKVAYEGSTMILFVKEAAYSYSMSKYSNVVLTPVGGEPITLPVEGSSYKLYTNNYPIGDYVLNYNKDLVPVTQNMRIVYFLEQMEEGVDYTDRQTVVSKIGTENNEYVRNTVDAYSVGTGSPFAYDLKLSSDMVDSNELPIAIPVSSDVITYTFYEKVGENYVELLENLVTINDDSVSFDSSLTGKTIKTEVRSRYQNLPAVIYEFVLNNGHNVMTDAQMKAIYSDLNVQTINVHRMITTVLNAEQYNADGTVKNMDNPEAHVVYNEQGQMTSNPTSCVYVRVSDNKANDNLIVNGNYFTILGNNLPFVSGNESGYPNQPGYLDVSGDGTSKVVNSQSAIFLYEVNSSNYSANLAAATASTTRAQFNALEGNSVTYNNLTVIGNSGVPTGDPNSEENIAIVNRNSGSYSALRAGTADTIVNNCVVRYNCIGLFITDGGADCIVNDSLIEESWANNIYGYFGSYFELNHTIVRNAGGSAIWIEDQDARNGDVFDPFIKVSNDSLVENYVSGTECWFNAHKLTMIGSFRAQLEALVSGYSGGIKIMIRTETNQTTGDTFEVFNFAIVIADCFSAEADTPALKAGFEIDGVTVRRTNAEFATEQRKQGNMFAAPVGVYSATSDFVNAVTALVPGLMGQGMTQEQAIAAAGQQVMATSFVNGSKFMELYVSGIPGVNPITVITEFFNK